MPIFGTPDKFNPTKGYRHVLFGQDGHLTEWELNELQKIQRQNLIDLTKALTGRPDGVLAGSVTFNGTTVTATNLQALVAGELVSFSGTLAATTGDAIYLALTETTVARAQDADLVHPVFPSVETTRRIRYDLALVKTNADATKRYLALGSIVGGNLVLTYNQLVPTADIGSDDINTIAFKAASAPLADYPVGMTLFQYTTGDAGYPLTNAIVTTYNPPGVNTGYQSISGLQTGRIHQRFRYFNGTAWTAWAREDEIELLRARTITAGTGLTGGGDLSANRTLSVVFAGTGAATTVARSDHHHDTAYVPLARTITAGAGLTGGGDMNANRSLAVDFAGSGTATTVARSDHNHSLASLTDTTIGTPAAGHTLRHSGTSWVNSFPTLNDNSDITLTSPASGHVLQHDGTKFVNRTLATAGIASSAVAISAGAGLLGGGDLTTSRTLSISFGGTGAANTVARSDHNHDTTYALRTLSIVAGSGLTGGGDLTTSRTLNISWGGTGTATTVARSDHNHDTRYVNLSGDTMTGALSATSFSIAGKSGMRNGGTSENSLVLFAATDAVFIRPNGEAATTGELAITANSVTHNAKALSYQEDVDTRALKATAVSAGAGLTGGGDLSVSRTLAVAFAGSGAATTVARSDHNHSLASLTDTTLTSIAAGELIKWDGTKFVNNTLAEAGIASRTLTLTAGAGLTGGGDLTANRTLAVSFAGTGAANTVARSDHNHDTTYARLDVVNTFTGENVFNAGGSTVALKAGAADHVYLSFFARTASLSTRSAYIGYGSTASTNFMINNEIAGGNITLFPGTGGKTSVTGALETTGTITEAGTLLSSKYAPIGTSISAGTGLTGGGTLAATRTLSVNFGGTGAATTVARSDHNHDSTYVNMAGAAQTISSSLTLTGALTMNGANYSPVGAGLNDASVAATSYPVGLTWEGNNAAATGYPSTVGSVLNFYASTARNFQLFHAKNTNNLYIRTWHDANNAWMTYQRLALDADVIFVDNKYANTSITAGSGLTGGGTLAASRTLSVSFGGTGSATTVARSDHNHDASYLGLSGGTLTGALNVPTINLDTANAGIEIGKSGATNTPFIDFRSSASVTDYDARIIASGGSAANGAGTLQLIGASITTSSNFAAGGTITEAGTSLASKYAARSTAISAGSGLTGGGDLTASRSLAVSFGGTGSATTVARSDHSHALTNITDVTITSPVAGHTLRHNGTAWVNSFPLISDNSDVTLTSIASGELLKWDGTKFINNTLAEAGIASTATSISPGAGLTGGGTLAATRTLSVNFAGTGTATTVARSDHSHAFTNLTDVNIASPVAGHTTRYNGTSWVNAFPTMNDNSDITLSSPASGHVLQHNGTGWVNRTLADAGIASRAVAVLAGTGLTGGGDITTTRSINVNFGGTGAATTVARSDHNHDTRYVSKIGDTMSGDLTTTGEISGRLRHLNNYFIFESFDAATYGTGQGQVWYDPSNRRIRFSSRHPADTIAQNVTVSSYTGEFNVINTPSNVSTLSINAGVDVAGSMNVTGGISLTGTTSTLSAYALRGTGTNLLIRSDAEVRAVKPSDVTTYIPVRASSFPTSSSIKYKQDVEDVTEQLDPMALIQSLGVKRYRLKADVAKGVLDKWKVGVIVEESPDIICDEDAVDTYTMLSLLIHAFQESEKEKAALKDDVNHIKQHLGLA